MPKVAVTCYERNTFQRLIDLLGGEVIANPRNANGDWPVYRVNYKGKEFAVRISKDVG